MLTSAFVTFVTNSRLIEEEPILIMGRIVGGNNANMLEGEGVFLHFGLLQLYKSHLARLSHSCAAIVAEFAVSIVLSAALSAELSTRCSGL